MKRVAPGRGFNPYKNPTPQGKLVATADKFGNRGIKKMQGSSRSIYHFLPLAVGAAPNSQVFRFFENVNTQFPFTNLQNGKMEVGEAMVLERMYFLIMRTDQSAVPVITNIQNFTQLGVNGLYLSQFNFMNSNNQVIKPTSLIQLKGQSNKSSQFNEQEVLKLDTDITLQPLVEFMCELRTPNITVPAPVGENLFIGCVLEGAGAILNPRTNF